MSSNPEAMRRTQFWVTVMGLVVVVAVACLGTIVYSRKTDYQSDPYAHVERSWNGFDVSQSAIPADDIHSGGPPKDGIPALTDPRMIPADKALFLRDDDRVIGVAFGDAASAYPLRILEQHEIVNAQVGDMLVAVTYCPLCDSAAAFDRRDGEQVREFGVSGLLYNSNVLMHDRREGADSLYSQMMNKGVTGPNIHKPLTVLPLDVTTWADWRKRHPETRVLSAETGYTRDYSSSPYAAYFSEPRRLMFPVEKRDNRLPTKAPVLGIWTDDASRAYPLSAFDAETAHVEDRVGGRRVTLAFNPDAPSLRVVHADDGVRWVYSFWFAWYAFHPETDVFAPR